MGWLDLLLKAAAVVGTVILISEIVSFVINRQSLISWLRKKKYSTPDLAGMIKAKISSVDATNNTVNLNAFNECDKNIKDLKIKTNKTISSDVVAGDTLII